LVLGAALAHRFEPRVGHELDLELAGPAPALELRVMWAGEMRRELRGREAQRHAILASNKRLYAFCLHSSPAPPIPRSLLCVQCVGSKPLHGFASGGTGTTSGKR